MFVFHFYILHLIIVCTNGMKEDTFLQNIMDEITELKARQNSCEQYKAKVFDLEAMIKELKTRQTAYEANVSELETVVDRLQEQNVKLERKILRNQDDKESSKQMYLVQHADNPDYFTVYQNRRKRVLVDGQVAFTAVVSSPDLTNLGDHQTIIFDKPITNVGNAYSANSGIFQAPLKGIYVFTMTLMVVPRHSEYLDIVVDGNYINQIFADASSVDDYMSTTKQWVLDLNAGSEVWMRTSTFENRGEIHGAMHTTFSGFLLFETE